MAFGVVMQGRLEGLISLPKGWDGYQGEPVDPEIAKFAAKVLNRLMTLSTPLPDIVPGSDGSLQIEWHCNGYDIELDVLVPNRVLASRLAVNTGKYEEIEVGGDFSRIERWVRDIARH